MIITKSLTLSTKGNNDIIDITEKVQELLSETKLKEGSVLMAVIGSTAGLTTCENESGIIQDLKNTLNRLLPQADGYHHDSGHGEGNAHSHLRAAFIGPSLTIPFQNKTLLLGTWQQIIFIDFDTRARQRKIVVQFAGE